MSPSSPPDPNSRLNAPGIALSDLILDYTRLCNSRCTYCGIWREKDRPELAIEVIGRLFQATALQQLTSCYVTGGEPYISDKIVEIARLLHRCLPHARLSGATNGIQPAKILSRVLAIRELGCPVTVDVSLNGNEATHDRTRGQPGFWRNAVGLVRQLKAHGIPTNLAFSVMPETIGDYPFVRQLAKDLGCGVGLSWVRRSPRYCNDAIPLQTWSEHDAQHLRRFEPLPDYFNCPGLHHFLVVRPDGEVYPCETYHPTLRLGNIQEQALDAILASPVTAQVLHRIDARRCDWCQGTGLADGTPKWMIMDCYRRRSLPPRASLSPAGPPAVKSAMVSVVIPCYKQAEFLPDAVASVVGQSFRNWEIIVVDDGSPDNTQEVFHQLTQRYPGATLRCVRQPNGGLANARNSGIAAARGQFILPLDADDKLHPEMLSRTVALLESRPDIAIACVDTAQFGAAQAYVRAATFNPRHLLRHNLFSYCALYRREAWQAVGGYNPNMTWGYEDWDFWIGCAEHGYRGLVIHEPLFFYRVKETSMLTQAVQHDRELRARIVLNHRGLYDAISRAQAQCILGMGPSDSVEAPQGDGVDMPSLDVLSSPVQYGLPGLHTLALAYLQKACWPKAALACAKILHQTPDDTEVLLLLARCFFETGDFKTAEATYRRVLEIDTGHEVARENLLFLAAQSSSAIVTA